MYNTGYCCWILLEYELYWQIFEKYWNVEFHENSLSGNRAGPLGRTDSHDEVKKRVFQFYESAWNPVKFFSSESVDNCLSTFRYQSTKLSGVIFRYLQSSNPQP